MKPLVLLTNIRRKEKNRNMRHKFLGLKVYSSFFITTKNIFTWLYYIDQPRLFDEVTHFELLKLKYIVAMFTINMYLYFHHQWYCC